MPSCFVISYSALLAAAPGGGLPAPRSGALSDMLLLAAIVLLGLIGAAWLRKQAQSRAGAAGATNRRAARAPSRGRESLETLMADAEELARRIEEHLDRKAARLERLIAEADDRLARLDQQGAPPGRAPARPSHAPSLHSGYGAGASMMEARRSGAAGAFGGMELDPLSRQVYRLADDGLAPVEIARRLDEQTGKVELILALRES